MRARTVIARLRARYGPQRWWPCVAYPGRTARCLHPDEVAIGAILTQNTSWRNVEYALARLDRAGALSFDRIRSLPIRTLERHVHPSGFYRQKAQRLKRFARYWLRSGGAQGLRDLPTGAARHSLLGEWGIGPETADTILCYALNRPSFVVDAYTFRLIRELGLGLVGYDACKAYFEASLPRTARTLGEAHALIVAWGKERPPRHSWLRGSS